MFPWTGPSKKDANDRAVYRVGSVSPTGKVAWVDFIPVEEVTPTRSDSYDNGGAIRVEEVASIAGLREWEDYIPVAVINQPAAGKWRFDNTGYIPVEGLSPSLFFSILLEDGSFLLLEDGSKLLLE